MEEQDRNVWSRRSAQGSKSAKSFEYVKSCFYEKLEKYLPKIFKGDTERPISTWKGHNTKGDFGKKSQCQKTKTLKGPVW